jgi:peptidoglycan LD-endopeptidase CwlK
MPKFSSTSATKLGTCVFELREIFEEAVEEFDCTVLCGHRDQEAQDKAFETGRSKVQWPNGKHNTTPSLAADVAPYPIDWKDRERLTFFAGYVKGIAKARNVDIRWGGDWDSDTETRDNRFDDLVHFEILEK